MPVDIPPSHESTGYRRILTPDGTMLPGKMALELPDGMDAVTEPETGTRPARTKLAFSGLGIEPDDDTGGFFVGYADGGWVTVRSDAMGFRVRNSTGAGYSFEVANSSDEITVRGALQNVDGVNSDAMILMGDTGTPLSSLGSSAVAIQSVAGVLKVTQFSTPTVGGATGGNTALASLLNVLEELGLIINGAS